MRVACLNPAWSAFVGCCMNRDIKTDILAAGEWENPGDIEVADDPYTYLPRIWGVLKKKTWLVRRFLLFSHFSHASLGLMARLPLL